MSEFVFPSSPFSLVSSSTLPVFHFSSPSVLRLSLLRSPSLNDLNHSPASGLRDGGTTSQPSLYFREIASALLCLGFLLGIAIHQDAKSGVVASFCCQLATQHCSSELPSFSLPFFDLSFVRVSSKFQLATHPDITVSRIFFDLSDQAVVLDPRYKLLALEAWWKVTQSQEKATYLVSNLKIIISRLYDFYVAELSSSTSQRQVELEASSSTPQQNTDFPMAEDENDWLTIWCCENINSGDDLNEFQKYIKEPNEPSITSFDLLGWWKANKGRYPILAQMAREVLAIPTSTVASKSTFSTGGRVLDAYRSSLAPKTVLALICVQDWSRPPTVNRDLSDIFEDSESMMIDEELINQMIVADDQMT